MNQHLEKLDGLAPFLQEPAHQLVARCQSQLKRTLMIVFGWRSMLEQAHLYQQGRTWNPATNLWEVSNPALIVTRAQPGQTAHNVITPAGGMAAMAFDCIPLNPDGSPDWTVDDNFWDRLYELSWKVGLDPYGDERGGYLKADKGHFMEPGWTLKLDGLGLLLPGGDPHAAVSVPQMSGGLST
jgi:hypothetical protein